MIYPQRRSIRLQDYDYAQSGAYFVTICAYNRQCLFGSICDDGMIVNEWGQAIQACWDDIPVHFPLVDLDAFVVMPNHIHGIMLINDAVPVGATHGSPAKDDLLKQVSLGAIIGQFKSSVTRHFKKSQSLNQPLWQRNYYEHIIRSEESLNQIRTYIFLNPAKWADDSLYVS